MHKFLGHCYFYFICLWDSTSKINNYSTLVVVGYEMTIANSVLRASLTFCHLISNMRLWNNG